MLVKIICLTLAVLAVQAEIPLSRIQMDAATETDLQREHIGQTPAPGLKGLRQAACNVMLECCPTERANFYELMRTEKFESTCVPDRTLLSSKCTTLVQGYDSTKASPEHDKYLRLFSEIPEINERFNLWRERMGKVCSPVELEAHYCEPENYEKFRLCQEKVLHMIASENDGKDYENYVHTFENDYRGYKELVAKYFPAL